MWAIRQSAQGKAKRIGGRSLTTYFANRALRRQHLNADSARIIEARAAMTRLADEDLSDEPDAW
jgi:hypothetical protein